MSTKSLSEITQIFKELYSEQSSRRRCLSLLAESIKNAHQYAPNEWIIRNHPHNNKEGFRIVVGNLAIFDIERRRIWMALDSELLKTTTEYDELLNEEEGWQWKTGDRASGKKVPSRNGYYIVDKDPSEKLFSVVSELNSAIIKQIGSRKYKIAPDSRKKYEPNVIRFLREELNQLIPEPGSQSRSEHETDVVLPEEISESEAFHEGVRRKITVNAYERNQDARDECLNYYYYKCAVCEQYMSKIYGEVAEKLIHVHHLKPLSEVKEGYEVDPIKDLRPVCPNCHAVIHLRKPPYTIEEVKDFLEKARQDG